MPRTRLNDRRPSITRTLNFLQENGNVTKILITIGFDAQEKPREVFCADFKAGTTLHSIVMDACVMFSRLLQYGDTPAELLQSVCIPPSLIGQIAAAVAATKLDGPSDPINVRVPTDFSPSGGLMEPA